MKGVFVTGTDTGVGKTVLSAALMAAAPGDVLYAKPVQSGFPEDDDRDEVLRLAGLPAERAPDLGVKLRAPVSPHHAARLEGIALAAADLRARLERHAPATCTWIVEGAGGLLSPLSERETMLDLARELDLPVVVAAGVRLGAINATLLTLRALEAARVPCLGVVRIGDDDPAFASALRAFAPGQTLGGVPRLAPPTPPALLEAGRTLLAHARLRKALA
jgi:dethiobiotin synthetase